MKVLHIINSLQYGGAEKMAIDLVASLRKRGIDGRLCCLEGEGELAPYARGLGIPVTVYNKKGGVDMRLLVHLFQLIRREKFDLVHTHNVAPLIYGSLAAKFTGAVCLHTRHGRESKKPVRSMIWKINKAVVAISEDTRKKILVDNPLEEQKTTVIWNGINLDNYKPKSDLDRERLKSEMGLSSTDRVVGIVARLSPEKDHINLLRAFSTVLQANTNAVLLIIGGGKLETELRDSAKTLQISDRVKFLGFRTDIMELLGLLDVFVLSSVTEGLPLTILEAMAVGKPVVATRVGGNAEAVEEGVTGLLVEPQNPQELGRALLSIVADPDKGFQMGLMGRKRVERDFSLQTMTEKYLALYGRIASSGI